MNNIISEKRLETLREKFQHGVRVELVSMNDPYTSLKPGDRGVVDHVDDVGTIHIQWDNGSMLGAAYGADKIELAPEPMPDEVREQILKLRTLPGCPNMFDVHAVQRLALDNGFYAAVDWIENNRKSYSNFIFTGKPL